MNDILRNVMEKINYYCNNLCRELKLLERIIYKFKNQHGRLGYFKSIFRITKELKLFCIALQETFYNKNSTDNVENYYKNLRDLRKIVRRIKWDLKDAGISMSRILSHGFFLPMVFLLFSALSRVFSVIINIKVTIDHIITTLPFKPNITSQPGASRSKNCKNNSNNDKSKKSDTHEDLKSPKLEYFNEEDDDLGEVVSYESLTENNDITYKCENDNYTAKNISNSDTISKSRENGSLDDLTSKDFFEKNMTSSIDFDNQDGLYNLNKISDIKHRIRNTNSNTSIKLLRVWNVHMILRSKRRKLTK